MAHALRGPAGHVYLCECSAGKGIVAYVLNIRQTIQFLQERTSDKCLVAYAV